MPKATATQNLLTFAFSPAGSVELPAGDAGLTIESAQDKLSFMSDFDITRDARGLALAQSIADVLAGAIVALKRDQDAGKLPESLTLIKPTVRENPLG